jgi:hypothetical protein
MIEIKEQFVVDEQGRRVGVLLDIATYQMVLDALEELECIRAADRAEASGGRLIPLEEALELIESRRG